MLRILIEKQLDLDLVEAVAFAVGQYGGKVKAEAWPSRCWTSSSTACARATRTKAWTWPCTRRCVP